jgi:transcriptional regulator with XRE-family HTH domain
MNPEVLKQIGQRIHKARIRAGITQAELAEKLGVDRVAITRYENGHRGPHISDVPLLAQILNVSPLFFFEDSAESNSSPDS